MEKPIEVRVSLVSANWYPVVPASIPSDIEEAMESASDEFKEKVEHIRKRIREHKMRIEPIVVTQNGNSYRIKDGNARFFAWILEGKELVDVIIE